MTKELDFYYEFSSPYGYFAAMEMDDFASSLNVKVNWKPFLLGAIFKTVGTQPLLDYPMKGAYSENDMYRTARLKGLEFNMPARFPFLAVNAARLVLWGASQDQDNAAKLSKSLYRHAYVNGADINDKGVLAEVAAECGLDPTAAVEACSDPVVKAMLKDHVDAGIEAGVFGSPFFIYEGEKFWGYDRMDQLEQWIKRGGW